MRPACNSHHWSEPRNDATQLLAKERVEERTREAVNPVEGVEVRICGRVESPDEGAPRLAKGDGAVAAVARRCTIVEGIGMDLRHCARYQRI